MKVTLLRKGLNPFPNRAPLQGFEDYTFTSKP